MIEIVITSILAFVSTNIDDIFILMMLFTQQSATFVRQHIIFGQFLGIIALISLGMIGMLAGFVIPLEYIGLMGFFPIYLGLKNVYEKLFKKDEEPELQFSITGKTPHNFLGYITAPGTLNVAAITIANGGDNVGVYIPLFSTFEPRELFITITIFLLLTYCWVWLAEYLTNHDVITRTLKKINPYLFPVILIGLGIYIFIECNTISLLRLLH